MATSSILGGTELPDEVVGKDTRALGPSDNSDSGSDSLGAYGDEIASDTDSSGTGERASIGPGTGLMGADVMPDHIEQVPGDSDAIDAAGDRQQLQDIAAEDADDADDADALDEVIDDESKIESDPS